MTFLGVGILWITVSALLFLTSFVIITDTKKYSQIDKAKNINKGELP